MQSLERFLDILETVAESEKGIGATSVAQKVDLPIATASRLVHVLEDYDLLQRLPDRNDYILGPRLFSLVSTANQFQDLSTVARPRLEAIRDATGETVSLHVRRGRDRICILGVPSRHKVHRVVAVGSSEPLASSGATGAVLLAGMQEPDRTAAIEESKPSKAWRPLLEELIEHVLLYGWTITVDVWVPGLCGVSAAVRDNGEISATLSVSGPSSRFTRERALEHVDLLVSTADDLGNQLSGQLAVAF